MSGASYSDDDFGDRFGSAPAPALQARRVDTAGQATQIEQARAIAEVKAMVMIAMENPRNEERSREKMRRVCSMPALAERAFFRVPRGYKKDENGKNIKGSDGKNVPEFVNGETIQLARELARCWGNILYAAAEMSRDDIKGQSEMLAYAWDLEENVRPSTIFIVAHKLGTYRVTSNQQIYENNASHAGRRLREMIFNALPEWFKAEAIDLCHETLKKGDGRPMNVRVDACIEAYREMGVSVEMLQKKVGRQIREITPEDLANLRIVLKSLKRGEVTVTEEFPTEQIEAAALPTTERPTTKLDALEAASKVSDAEKPDAIADLVQKLSALKTSAQVDTLERQQDTRDAVRSLGPTDATRWGEALKAHRVALQNKAA